MSNKKDNLFDLLVQRISGWTGHILEQYAHNKLIRPRAEYIGARDLKYAPIGER